MDCSPPGSSVPGDSPGKNTGVGCHLLLQGIFPTQGLNPHLLHWQVDSLPLSHQGSWYLVSYCYYLPTADPEETKIHKVQPSTRSSSSSPQWDSDYFNALSFQVATDQSSVLFRNLNVKTLELLTVKAMNSFRCLGRTWVWWGCLGTWGLKISLWSSPSSVCVSRAQTVCTGYFRRYLPSVVCSPWRPSHLFKFYLPGQA